MTENINLYEHLDELTATFENVELKAHILTRFASPVKADLSRIEEYNKYYLEEDVQNVLTKVSDDLIENIKELKEKIEELKETIFSIDMPTPEIIDNVAILNKLL